MNKEDIYSYLMQSANSAISKQRHDGSYEPGHNNKWNDRDTPIRVTAHFSVQLAFAFRYTQDQKYLDVLKNAASYLLSHHARPGGKTFFCRVSSTKSMCNGLIGQAWAVEALLHIYSVLGESEYLEVAKEVYMLHPFDFSHGLYCPVECDGSVKAVAKTINHQLIFVAQGMWLLALGVDSLEHDLKRFFALLPRNISLTGDGLINHYARKGRNDMERKIFDLARYFQRKKMHSQSQGYQSFNMFGLALSKRNHPTCAIWEMEDLKKILQRIYNYVNKQLYIESVLQNEFALAYRLTGQEICFYERVFGLGSGYSIAHILIDEQFRRFWDSEEKLLCAATGDPQTLSSRLYEMWYFYESLET